MGECPDAPAPCTVGYEVGGNVDQVVSQFVRLYNDFERIIGLVADGTFVPMLDKVFPFAEALPRITYIQDRKNFDKVLLRKRAEPGMEPASRSRRYGAMSSTVGK